MNLGIYSMYMIHTLQTCVLHQTFRMSACSAFSFIACFDIQCWAHTGTQILKEKKDRTWCNMTSGRLRTQHFIRLFFIYLFFFKDLLGLNKVVSWLPACQAWRFATFDCVSYYCKFEMGFWTVFIVSDM